MNPTIVLLIAVVGAVVGFAVAWWIRRAELQRERDTAASRLAELGRGRDEEATRANALQGKVTELTGALAAAKASLQQIDTLKEERDAARRALDVECRALAQLRTDYATLQTQSDEKLAAANEKIELLRAAGEDLKKEFENLAHRIFDEKREKFTQANKDSIEGLLKPVREQLTDFKKKVEDVYDKETKDRTSLRTEILNLQKASERAGSQAESLAKALTGDSRVRGNWGEISLERILEESGLRKGHEYEVQETHQNEDGQRLRPDVIVRLPERKAVIIDSKVSLVAYERYHAAQSEEARQQYLSDHVAAIRVHVRGLSAKNYQDIIGVNSLDLVLMFVPIEPAFLLALEQDASLFNEAFNRKVLLVSPTTLMGTLQIIYNIWRHEYQNRNALEIADSAAGLYDQFVLFAESLKDVGERLSQAQAAYDTTQKRLVTGKGNLVRRAENLIALGVKAKRKLDTALVDSAKPETEPRATVAILEALPDVADQDGAQA